MNTEKSQHGVTSSSELNDRIFSYLDTLTDGNIRNSLMEHFYDQHGLYLAKIITYESMLLDNLKYLADADTEHGESLGLLAENVYQKALLDDYNERLSAEIAMRIRKEEELIELKRKLEIANRELEELSVTDGLTDIANRRYFDRQYPAEWRRALRTGSEISLFMVDIDHFKAYNDTYGHLMGDECIKNIALALAGNIKRAGDFVARYGGEEFAIILINANIDNAKIVAEKCRQSVLDLRIPHSASKVCEYVTISMGISTIIPMADMDHTILLKRADEALYQAKELGRNRISAAEDSLG